jgi:hypothetical protein
MVAGIGLASGTNLWRDSSDHQIPPGIGYTRGTKPQQPNKA